MSIIVQSSAGGAGQLHYNYGTPLATLASVAAGDYLIAIIDSYYSHTVVTSVTDNASGGSNTYTKIAEYDDAVDDSGHWIQIWLAQNTSPQTNLAINTAPLNSGTLFSTFYGVTTGGDTLTFDAGNLFVAASSTNPSVGPLTTSTTDLIIAYATGGATYNSSQTFSNGSGYTLGAVQNYNISMGSGTGSEYAIGVAAGSVNASFVLSPAQSTLIAILGFYVASAVVSTAWNPIQTFWMG
jgi:hypothetical protein